MTVICQLRLRFRLCIMRLEGGELKFGKVAHHARVTQCLGAIGSDDWFLGVAKPTIVDGCSGGERVKKSRSGHCYLPPRPEDVRVFRVSGPKFLKLNAGTWHFGPFFRTNSMYFYNLELTDTYVSIIFSLNKTSNLSVEQYFTYTFLRKG